MLTSSLDQLKCRQREVNNGSIKETVFKSFLQSAVTLTVVNSVKTWCPALQITLSVRLLNLIRQLAHCIRYMFTAPTAPPPHPLRPCTHT